MDAARTSDREPLSHRSHDLLKNITLIRSGLVGHQVHFSLVFVPDPRADDGLFFAIEIGRAFFTTGTMAGTLRVFFCPTYNKPNSPLPIDSKRVPGPLRKLELELTWNRDNGAEPHRLSVKPAQILHEVHGGDDSPVTHSQNEIPANRTTLLPARPPRPGLKIQDREVPFGNWLG